MYSSVSGDGWFAFCIFYQLLQVLNSKNYDDIFEGKTKGITAKKCCICDTNFLKSATFASTSRDWLKPQPQQQHQQQEQGAKQTKTEDCEFSIVNGTTRFLVLGTPCNWSNTRIFVWPAISIQQGMMIYPTPAMQVYTLARNSYLLHLY